MLNIFLPSTLFVASVALGNTATKGFFWGGDREWNRFFHHPDIPGNKKRKKVNNRDVYSFICLRKKGERLFLASMMLNHDLNCFGLHISFYYLFYLMLKEYRFQKSHFSCLLNKKREVKITVKSNKATTLFPLQCLHEEFNSHTFNLNPKILY